MEKLLRVGIAEAGYPNGFHLMNVFFTLDEGEMLLVTGGSGSGKTTLMKTIANTLWLDGGYVYGEVLINGRDVKTMSFMEINSLLTYIPQEPWYGIVGHTVYAEFCHALSINDLECSVEMLDKYGLRNQADQVTYGLSAGQYQRLLWAESLESNKKLLLLDEPYTYIDRDARGFLKKMVEKHLSSGASLIIIDHLPGNWADYEPYQLVLDHGRVVYYGRYKPLVENDPGIDLRRRVSEEKVLEARGLWFRYPGYPWVLKGVDLELRRGESIGLVGLNGAGKTTLLKLLAGVVKPSKGSVVRHGSVIYVPENPLLYFTHPTPRMELYSSTPDHDLVDRVVEELGLEKLLDQPLARLSSGERRRVALASCILRGYDIYLLDEPTGGLDRDSLYGVLNVLKLIIERGGSLITAHHDPRLIDRFNKTCVLDKGVLECS